MSAYDRRIRMNQLHAANCARIAQLFEGREAIYDENGFWRVRVSHIKSDVDKCCIDADVEEIPTPALDVFRRGKRDSPHRWHIDSGYLTIFSDHFWSPGISSMIGWGMWFAPSLIEEVVRMAQDFPHDADRAQRYMWIMLHINRHPQSGRAVRAFPDGTK